MRTCLEIFKKLGHFDILITGLKTLYWLAEQHPELIGVELYEILHLLYVLLPQLFGTPQLLFLIHTRLSFTRSETAMK